VTAERFAHLRVTTVTALGKLFMALLGAVVGLLVAGCSSDNQQPRPETKTAEQSSEMLDASVACMRERGWDIEVREDESWYAPGVSEEQYDAYVADTNECREANETIEQPEDVSAERWKNGYDAVLASAECLRDQGYDIPKAPSFQAWKDTFFVGDGANQWLPWSFVPVPSMSADEFTSLEENCPQVEV